MIELMEYEKQMQGELDAFFHVCLPESGRVYEPFGRHRHLQHPGSGFVKFWVLKAEARIIGTAALGRLKDDRCCELKCLYLSRDFQGYGYGGWLLDTAVAYARGSGYQWMYLDTLSTSQNAVMLYRKRGFQETERYNQNQTADLFMRRKL